MHSHGHTSLSGEGYGQKGANVPLFASNHVEVPTFAEPAKMVHPTQLEAIMYRLSFVLLVLLAVSVPVLGQQTNSKDPQTLQALLAEVRQLRQDFEATAAITHKTQVLLYRLQTQNTAIARLSRSVDDAHTDVSQLGKERDKLAADIKQHEDFVSSNTNTSGDRKAVEDAIPGLKDQLASLEDQLQQAQERESAAQEQLRSENARLDKLETELDRLEKSLETKTDAPAKNSQ
jgi:chromosome segregation ATPase